jgi:hypothetical protein
MACGCQKQKRVYVVTKGDGTTAETSNLSEAMTMVRRYGGSYQLQMK